MKTAILLLAACLCVSLAIADEFEGDFPREEAGIVSRKMLDFKSQKFCDPNDKVKTCTGKNEFCSKLDHPKCNVVKKCEKVCVKYGYKKKGKFCVKYGQKCSDKKGKLRAMQIAHVERWNTEST
ncbi:unnamed protein product [Ostreobium quekettii]|uniref:Uncharacterized protein n=1 Tax=Ostreobium quekettii TaxID=121088 RepID=A0A8S1JCF3_9CHLO|nr:unnamed protein product [Ostreobium quekettii]